MQPRNIIIWLTAVLLALAVIGWQRWSAGQRQLAIRDLNASSGVTMLHFYADW